jgi:hypothetical protein
MNELITYTSENVETFSVVISNDTVWLTQAQIAELFGTKRPAVTKHLINIFNAGELKEEVVCSILEHTTQHGALIGKTQKFNVTYYNLDAIISVGYRVNSVRATQFRQWATNVLREHLLNGYTIRHEPSIEQLNALRFEIDHILQRQNRMDELLGAEFGKVYEMISQMTEYKKLHDTPRRRIGFLQPGESEFYEKTTNNEQENIL